MESRTSSWQSETLTLCKRLIPSRRLRWLLFVLTWTIAGAFSMIHWRALALPELQYGFWVLLRLKLILWVLWGLFTPVILKIAARWRIETSVAVRNGPVMLVASLVVTTLYLIAYSELLLLAYGGDYERISMYNWVSQFNSSYYYLAFWVTVGVEHAIGLYNRYHERQMRMVKLESQMTQVQLQALRGRLQPHFLFNTLHSIVALMRKNEIEVATGMLTKLSDLLRASLEHLDRHEVRLGDELDLLSRYLDIEQIRFADRLEIVTETGDDTLDAYVPSFILQPIVENAIKHGITKRAGSGTIRISATLDGDLLHLTVCDNGIGMAASQRSGEGWGIGLETTRTRLETMYGPRHELIIADDDEAGVAVSMKLPYHTKAEYEEIPTDGRS